MLPPSSTLKLEVTDYSETSVTTRLRGLLFPKTTMFLVIPVRISDLTQIRIRLHLVFSYQWILQNGALTEYEMDLILLEYATIIYTDPSSNITPERSLNTLNSELNINASIQTGLQGRTGFLEVP